MRFVKTSLLAGLGAGFASLVLAAGASAATPGTVSTTPASFTPWLLRTTPNQRVEQLLQCGSTMYAVGTISSIGQGRQTFTRGNAFSFSATTGVLTSWNPAANAPVRSIALSPDCSTAYLGGSFTTVRGVASKYIAAVDTTTGAVKTGFARDASNAVMTVQYTHGAVIAGGAFTSINGVARSRMASLDPSTGAVTSYLNIPAKGTYPRTSTEVYNSQLSHAGDRMLIEGVFTSLGSTPRQQVAMLDLNGPSVVIDNWFSTELNAACDPIESFYARSANWSPDDATVYIASTGYKPASGPGSATWQPRAGLCDAVAAFPATSTNVAHEWVNYTGCDSYYSVAADANNVYVSGHERWANNGFGCDAAGPGALSRPGIASINPTTGQATAWNPTRALGYGTHELYLTGAGLWVASDIYSDGNAQKCGAVTNKGGICLLPY
ncbi:MAG: hypothetical protein ACRDWT_15085 [Jatrophihabitantaceae bacterium]